MMLRFHYLELVRQQKKHNSSWEPSLEVKSGWCENWSFLESSEASKARDLISFHYDL